MSYTNYSRNKYRNLSIPVCPINVIVQDDNIKKPRPSPHLYYPNYPDLGYPGNYPYGYPYGYPGFRPYVQTNQETNQDETMPKPKSRSVEKTHLNPKFHQKSHPNPHCYYDSSSSSDSDYRYRCHAKNVETKRDKRSHIPDPDIDPIFDPCFDPENIISDMIPNRVFDEESIKKKVDICHSKNYTKPFAKLVSKFVTPEIKTQIEKKEKDLNAEEKVEKTESLGNSENQKVENDKKIYLKQN